LSAKWKVRYHYLSEKEGISIVGVDLAKSIFRFTLWMSAEKAAAAQVVVISLRLARLCQVLVLRGATGNAHDAEKYLAAALYQSAALFRFQTGDPGDALPTGNVPIPGVTVSRASRR